MNPTMIEQCEEMLKQNWVSFCDFDPLTPPHLERDSFIEQMELAGLVYFRSVTKNDVENDPFASECGIEMGSYLWCITDAGRAALERKKK